MSGNDILEYPCLFFPFNADVEERKILRLSA